MKWYLLLMSFLMPGIGPDDEPADDEPADADEPEPDDADEPADDEPADEIEPDDEPEPAPRESRAQKTIRETRERAQKAESDLATARAELETARRGPAQPTGPTQDQLLWQQEEDVLRNPEADQWQRYAVQANRAARAATSTSQAALQRAEDLADRSAFAALATTKPKLYERYKDKVEAKLVELRKEGRNVNREGILKVMLGEDMLSGNLKQSDAKPKPSGGASRAARPSSDVPRTSGRMSEDEARTKRLENVRI